MQLREAIDYGDDAWNVASKIRQRYGIFGFYRGISSHLLRTGLFNFVYLTSFSYIKAMFPPPRVSFAIFNSRITEKPRRLSRYRLTFELLILNKNEVRKIVGPLTVLYHLRHHLRRMEVYLGRKLFRWCENEKDTAKHVPLAWKKLSHCHFHTRRHAEFEEENIRRGLQGVYVPDAYIEICEIWDIGNIRYIG